MLSCQTSCKLSDFGDGFSTATAIVISLNKTALERFGHSFYRARNNPWASPIRFLRPELQLSICCGCVFVSFPPLPPSLWMNFGWVLQRWFISVSWFVLRVMFFSLTTPITDTPLPGKSVSHDSPNFAFLGCALRPHCWQISQNVCVWWVFESPAERMSQVLRTQTFLNCGFRKRHPWSHFLSDFLSVVSLWLLLSWYPVTLDCDRAGNSCVIYVQSVELLGQVGRLSPVFIRSDLEAHLWACC